MKLAILIATLLHLQLMVLGELSIDNNSEDMISVEKDPFKRETIYPYAKSERIYNLEPLKTTKHQSKSWKNYVIPIIDTDEPYAPPVRRTKVLYHNHIPSTSSAGWMPYAEPIVIRSRPSGKAKLQGVNVRNLPYAAETVNLANLMYHNDEVNRWAPKKMREVVINVNVGYKNNQTRNSNGNNRPVQPMLSDKIKAALKTTGSRKPTLNKMEKMQAQPQNGKDRNSLLPLKRKLDPVQLMKNGKIKMKETKLSEHDSLVEVIMPPMERSDSSSGESDSDSYEHESFESKAEPRKLRNCKKESINAATTTTTTTNTTTATPISVGKEANGYNAKMVERPIVKNRFVVLHLKDGEKVIKDPLVKFLTKV